VKGKKSLEFIFWMVFSALMYAVGMSVAVTAPLMILAAPVPFMMIVRRLGHREAFIAIILGTGLIQVLLGTVSALMFLVAFATLGTTLGLFSLKAKSGVDYIAAAIMASVLSKVVLMVVFTRMTGVNPFILSPEAASSMVNSVSDVLASAGVGTSSSAIQSYAQEMVESIALLMPSMLILFSVLDTFVSYGIVRKALLRLGDDSFIKLPPFGSWRCPKNILWALLASLIMDVASKAFPDQRLFTVLSINLMEVMRGVFMVEGLSLMWYFMTKRNTSKYIKIAAVSFCAVFSPASYILSMVGIFDIWYDLRKRIRRKK
jgi:uncharacterized protein YybS (DUF2232 family)